MSNSIDRYPAVLVGGYYDGARLIGTRKDEEVAEYYNPNSHGIVEYRYNAENGRLDADFNPERSLPSQKTVAEYIRETRKSTGYGELSQWAKQQRDDQ